MLSDTPTNILPMHEWFSPEPKRHQRRPSNGFAWDPATTGNDFTTWFTTTANNANLAQHQFAAYRDVFTRADVERAARQLRDAPILPHRPATYVVHPDTAVDEDLIATLRRHQQRMTEEQFRLLYEGRHPRREEHLVVDVAGTPVFATVRTGDAD